MAGKSVLCLVSGILLFSIIVPVCPADEISELYQVKEHVCQLIEAGKYSEAKAATDKMTIEYAGQEKLPEMLYWVAERYQRFDRFEDAKGIYQQIVQNYPDSPWAGKARMGNARSEAMSLVISGKYEEAKEATDKMAADFTGNPDLPEAIYWNAVCFNRANRFEDGKQLYQKIVDDYPNSPWANKARFGVARTNLTLLITSQDYQRANPALDNLISDYAKNPDLPEALYWITERYERAGRAEDAKRNYQRVIDLFPYSPFAKKAKLGILRAEVRGFVEAKDFNNADIALNKMASDFANHPDLPETLYWLAQRYQDIGRIEDANRIYQQIAQNYANTIYASKIATEHPSINSGQAEIKDANLKLDLEKKAVEVYRVARGYEDSNQFALARQTYEKVIKEYPGTIKAGNAVLDIRRVEIEGIFDAGDMNTMEGLLVKFISDFNQNPYASICLDQLAEKYYIAAIELKKEDKPLQARDFFTGAERIWQQIIDINLSNAAKAADTNTSEILGKAYYYAAGCRQEWKNWDGAIEYFQKVVDNYPAYEYACGAQAGVGWCYEELRDLNEVPKETINPLAEEAYKAVLAGYKDCYAAPYAAYRLGELSLEKGNKADAITYYRKFLMLDKTDNEWIKNVQEKLSILEQFDPNQKQAESGTLAIERFDEQLTAEGGAGK